MVENRTFRGTLTTINLDIFEYGIDFTPLSIYFKTNSSAIPSNFLAITALTLIF